MAVAVDITAHLVAMRRVTMVLVWRPVVLDPGRRLPMHLALILPQPLALPLRVASMLLTGRVAMLRLVLMMLV